MVEVSTDKVDAEVPAPAAGTVTRIFVDPDETIEVGKPLAEIDPNGAAPAAAAEPAADEAPAGEATADEAPAEDAGSPEAPDGASAAPATASQAAARPDRPKADGGAPRMS